MNNHSDKFIKSAEEHGRYTLIGDASKTNAACRRMRKASQVLRATEDNGETAFYPLLRHPDPAVKTWAAYYLLSIKPDDAKRTLEAVASGTDLIAFGAEVTLREWIAGRLQIL